MSQSFLSAASLAAHKHKHHHYELMCQDPEGWGPLSNIRPLDFTPCFETGVLLNAPVILLIISLIVQMANMKKKGPWQARSAASMRILRMKLTFLTIAAAFALIHAILTMAVAPRTFANQETYTGLFLFVALILAIPFTRQNHHYSRRSSSVILSFWPIYLLAVALRIHTMILQDIRSLSLIAKVSFSMWMAAIGFGLIAYGFECLCPERPGKDGYQPVGDGEDNDSKEELFNESPMMAANMYSRLTFSWLTPMLQLGTKKFLGEEDMWTLPPSDSAESLGSRVAFTWARQQAIAKSPSSRKSKANLKIALAQAFGGPFAVAGFLKLIYDCLAFVQPQLLRMLLRFVESYRTEKPMPPAAGFGIAILMFVSANVGTAVLHQYFDRCFATTMRVRSGLVTLIYRKSLILSNGERNGRTTGDIVNLQSVDAVRIADLCQYGHIAWSGPLQIILAFISLYNLVGWQAFVGVGIMIVTMPLNTLIARYQKRMQRKLMKAKDARTRIMNEVLSNIKSIKLYGWEKAFAQKVLDIRNNQELAILRKIGIINGASFFFWSSTPFMVAFATFLTFATTSSRPLSSEIIFPAISLFSLLSFPLAMFAQIISAVIEASVSAARLEDFLDAAELQEDSRKLIQATDKELRTLPVCEIKGGEFKWQQDATEATLENIDLSVMKGELVAVLGRVGDGKTSLISALLGEMTRTEGSVTIRGTVAYFGQSSWILSDTVQANIVFGHRFDPVFYEKVLDACALRADLDVLPQGHMTEVGEKGVSLSGGQKSRICLARACYARADLYLLDDPLSAVDAHVGKHIFNHVIGPNGLLKGKARIISTNAVNILPECDTLIMLRRGIILERNTYEEVMTHADSELHKLITGLGKQSATKGDESSGSATPTVIEDSAVSVDDDNVESPDETTSMRKRRMSMATLRKASMLSTRQAKRDAIRDLRESAKPKEHSEKGSVKKDVYKSYMSAASKAGVIIFLLAMLGSQGTSILANYILRYWGSRNAETGETSDASKYLTAYGVVGLAGSILTVMSSLVLRLYCALRSSKKLHDESFLALMRSPLSYFEATPQGRILNLFTRDIFVVDEVLPNSFGAFFRTTMSVLAVVVVIAAGAPYVLLAFIPLGFLYRIVMSYYLATSRELKRLDAVSRSPIFAWFGETLSGVSTIRAYNQQSRFMANNEARLDRNQSCYLPAMAINRWLACRLEFLGSCLMFTTALTSVGALLIWRKVDSGMVGLLLSYTLTVTGALNWAVRSASEVEQNIVSAERVLGYGKLAPEAAAEIPEAKPDATWPREGSIEFDNFSMRYRPDLELCLKDVSVKIEAGEKVGVCGRTGAGKSSLTLALFRILEAAQGRIIIDGVDISKIGLQDLRSIVSIIPQDPQLFEGTLRGNIDPVDVSSDAEIWQALEHAHLKEHVMNNMGGSLDAEISEGGSNLSSGQRQLICFARALLRKTKILILDEATSSIDLETDEAVQAILRGDDFKGITTITIAHRLNTILDSDKILCMDQGRVAEYDSPEVLLERPTSLFYSLVQEAGLAK